MLFDFSVFQFIFQYLIYIGKRNKKRAFLVSLTKT